MSTLSTLSTHTMSTLGTSNTPNTPGVPSTLGAPIASNKPNTPGVPIAPSTLSAPIAPSTLGAPIAPSTLGASTLKEDATRRGVLPAALWPAALRCLLIVALSFLITSLVPIVARASSGIDTSASCSLRLSYQVDEVSMSGVEFKVYRVADIDDAGQPTLSSDFASSGVDISAYTDAEGNKTLATTLSAYASANNITAVARGTTNESGILEFDDLGCGLYLVVGENTTMEGDSYSVTPIIIMLPTFDESTGAWTYTVVATAKYEVEPIQEFRTISVHKVWSDGDSDSRPESVVIRLLRDGETYADVELNASNNWTYTWEDLANIYEEIDVDGKVVTHVYKWEVVELEVPSGYTVAVNNSNYAFTITNTAPAGTPSSGSDGTSSKLPQTGQLNWPIPVMSLLGLVLVMFGVYLRRTARADAPAEARMGAGAGARTHDGERMGAGK